ncbi:MAG TPA: hypothetical protein VIR29_00635 [Anseongella sp.]
MKTIKISAVVLFFAISLAACQPSAQRDEADNNEPVQKERVEEPQVRDGIAETEMRDSLATDTAAADTL